MKPYIIFGCGIALTACLCVVFVSASSGTQFSSTAGESQSSIHRPAPRQERGTPAAPAEERVLDPGSDVDPSALADTNSPSELSSEHDSSLRTSVKPAVTPHALSEQRTVTAQLQRLRPKKGVYADKIEDAKVAADNRRAALRGLSRTLSASYARQDRSGRSSEFVAVLENLWRAMQADPDARSMIAMFDDAKAHLDAVARVEEGLTNVFKLIGPQLADPCTGVLLGALGTCLRFSDTLSSTFDPSVLLQTTIPQSVLFGYSGAWWLQVSEADSFVIELSKNGELYRARHIRELVTFVLASVRNISIRVPSPYLSLGEHGFTLPSRPICPSLPSDISVLYQASSDLVRMNLWLLYGVALYATLAQSPADTVVVTENCWAMHGYAAVCVSGFDASCLLRQESAGATVGAWRTALDAYRQQSYASALHAHIPSPNLTARVSIHAFDRLISGRQVPWRDVRAWGDWSLATLAAVAGAEYSAGRGAVLEETESVAGWLESIAWGGERQVAVRAVDGLSLLAKASVSSAQSALIRLADGSGPAVSAHAILGKGTLGPQDLEAFGNCLELLIASHERKVISYLVERLEFADCSQDSLLLRKLLVDRCSGLDDTWRVVVAPLMDR